MEKSSNGGAMAKKDSVILGMQVDVNKAYDLLKIFKEAGKNRIDIQTVLDEAAPKIVGYKKYLEKLTAKARKKLIDTAQSSPQ